LAVGLEERVAQLRAAGDETRIRLLALLAKGERTVKELTDILGQSQPRVSRHLKVLSEARLVSRTPEGSWVYYRLADDADGKPAALAVIEGLDPEDPKLRRDSDRLDAVRQANREAAERYFADHAGEWDRIRSLHVPEKDVEAAILAAAGQGPFRAMLDIGTGTGRMIELFADRCERLLGIDLSQAMLAVARANLERAGIAHARVRVGECTNLPVVRESFDLVVIHQVLHFLDDPAAALAEAARALAPGGRLVVVDFAPHAHEFLRETQAHRRLGFAHGQVLQWLTTAGLRPDSAGPHDLVPASSDGLTVTLWGAADVRAAGALQAAEAPR
jgi:ArsR family transcriptional regulator